MLISVVIPTIPGREASLQRAIQAFCDTTPSHEIVLEYDHSTCGSGWDVGARRAVGDYICLSADDHEPLEGWWEPLVEAVDQGYCPASVVLNSDGTLQSAGMNGWNANLRVQDWLPVEHTLTPFMSRAQWEKVGGIPRVLHFCTDIWVSAVLKTQVVVREKSRVVHHSELVGRGAGMREDLRNVRDRALFAQLLREREAACASAS